MNHSSECTGNILRDPFINTSHRNTFQKNALYYCEYVDMYASLFSIVECNIILRHCATVDPSLEISRLIVRGLEDEWTSWNNDSENKPTLCACNSVSIQTEKCVNERKILVSFQQPIHINFSTTSIEFLHFCRRNSNETHEFSFFHGDQNKQLE